MMLPRFFLSNFILGIALCAQGSGDPFGAPTALSPLPFSSGVGSKALPSGKYEVTFLWLPEERIKEANISGSWNGWNPAPIPMQGPNDHGGFTATVTLPPGEYQYKYVGDGTKWHLDPANPITIVAADNETNSHFSVGIAKRVTFPLPESASVLEVGKGIYEVKLRWMPLGEIKQPAVLGSFNNWHRDRGLMQPTQRPGEYQITLRMRAGSYEYKFLNGEKGWSLDPLNRTGSNDGKGNENSILVIGKPVPAKAPAPAAKLTRTVKKLPTGEFEVLFRWKSEFPMNGAGVAGTFNNWVPGSNPFTDVDGDGIHTATVITKPGGYQYKFVANPTDALWHLDPSNPRKGPDTLGGENSLILLDDSALK